MSTDGEDISTARLVLAPTPRQQIESRLAMYYEQEQRLMRQGQQYQIGDGPSARMKRNVELELVQSMIASLQGQIAQLDNAGTRRAVVHIR